MSSFKVARTSVLEMAYEERGKSGGFPCILLHGFPDDVRAWDAVADELARLDLRIIVPYLRGYGPTRFLSDETPRSGQQAALGNDVLELADSLGLKKLVLAGYDWGGRAAAIASALKPELVAGLVLAGTNSYPIYKNAPPPPPADFVRTHAYWYQWFFNLEWGQRALESDRRSLCHYLWKTWSPTWKFDSHLFDATAPSWDNPDFVEVVIHSYRHRHGNMPGDPRYEATEKKLITGPAIPVPTILLPGAEDRVDLLGEPLGREKFTGRFSREVVEDAGHFVPRERPKVVVDAIMDLVAKV
ncbi:MAG TPA: alpha/beta hydrolase [Planctomycetota bacterium]|nr:alpha/beta hydrolase [Planctomycetota bacterium]